MNRPFRDGSLQGGPGISDDLWVFKSFMGTPYKIAISLSIALAVFFTLPWFTLYSDAYMAPVVFEGDKGLVRIAFLFVSVFITSLIFFYYNFSGKRIWRPVSAWWLRRILTALVNMVLAILLSVLLARLGRYLMDFQKTFFVFYVFRNLSIGAVAMLVTYAYNAMERSKQDRIKILTLSHEKIETELAMLRTQVDPHFLFNSLSSLAGVIRENQNEAVRFVSHLSDTFRYVLEKHDQNLVTLSEELGFLSAYLYMMQVRFKDGFQVTMGIDEHCQSKKIPQMGLQLLVENAIKHNLVSKQHPLSIDIATGGNHVIVSNTLQPKRTSVKGYGMGLAMLRRHYKLLGKETITVVRTPDEFKVFLPML
jgi:sensor histidine kinase YesM